MSNYTTYDAVISNKLANTSEIFYDAEMKREACNQVVRQILDWYDIPEMTVKGHITFDSNGIATKPSDYTRMVKLWSSAKAGSITAFANAGGGEVTVTSAAHGLANGNIVEILGTTSYNGIFTIQDVTTNTFNIVAAFVADDATGTWSHGAELSEYIYLVPDVFDEQAPTASYYWTEDYVASASARRLKVLPVSSGVLNIRYIQAETAMNDDVIDSGLPSTWDEVVAHGAVSRLFQNANRYDEAQEHERLYKRLAADVYVSVKNPGGIKQNNRLKSKFERISQLGINSI